jgi:squalene-hopene/tetraprenyl-beta-curcumene cyclase
MGNNNIEYRIKSLPLTNSVKSYLIGTGNQLNKKHKFYINLVRYYSPAFQNTDNNKLDELSDTAYLYFRSLLLIDSIMDNHSNGKENQLLLFLPIFEEAMKKLSWLFNEDSAFWNKFNFRKKEYFEAFVIEKKIHLNYQISEAQFEKIASAKSSVCYSIIDALCELLDKTFDDSSLIRSLKHIHTAFQYLDDTDDFKQDLDIGQRTYAQCLVENEITKRGITQTGKTFKHKFLFTSGIAEHLISNAITNLNEAKKIATHYKLNELSDFLNSEIALCQNQIYEINLLIEKSLTKSKKSKTLVSKNELPVAITSAIIYLEKSINDKGLFEDFMTSAGKSMTWATAYAGVNLVDIPEANNKILPLIKSSLINSGRGAYNETIIEDSDSLSFLIWFLKSSDTNPTNSIVTSWLNYMDDNGGWSTYKNEILLRERLKLESDITLKGWISPVQCVSAVALNVLTLFPELSHQFHRTSEFLLKRIDNEMFWKSYWWSSDIYATSFTIIAFTKNKNLERYAEAGCQWLVNTQNENGSWNTHNNQENAFYTALACNALMKYDYNKYTLPIKKAVFWLVNSQTDDGSWISGRILRIPATDVVEPEKVKKWRNSSFGVNIIVDDHNRIFTTTTVVNALNTYSRLFLKS